MPQRIKVLFIPHRYAYVHNPALAGVTNALNSQHELRIYDPTLPLQPQIEDAVVVVDPGGEHSTREMADLAHAVKLWQIMGTGFDHFDTAYWRQKGIPVANTPGTTSAIPLAECALMFMLMLARRWHETQVDLGKGRLYACAGQELEGRRLLLFGFGASAQALATRALPFGMKISAIDIREVPEAEQRKFELQYVGKPEDLDRLLPECDYLSLHLHLNASTRHVIDARRLKLMKPSARLINVARGALVDEAALYQALVEGQIAGAGLDVFGSEPVDPASPILHLPNVVATPHISGVTDGTVRRRAVLVAENINRVADGLEPLYRVA